MRLAVYAYHHETPTEPFRREPPVAGRALRHCDRSGRCPRLCGLRPDGSATGAVLVAGFGAHSTGPTGFARRARRFVSRSATRADAGGFDVSARADGTSAVDDAELWAQRTSAG